VRPQLLGLAAFFSGVAALVWQILWIRRLSEAFGHTAYAVNAVLAIFFAGLGLGAWLLGRAADRRQGSIALYCALEVAIAAAGLAFAPACDAVGRFYLSFTPAEWPLSSSLLFNGAASALLLAVPTLAMGGTLPALLRHAVRSTGELGVRVGWLYGLNTIGAAFGTAIAVLSWIPQWGVAGATAGAIALNLAAAAVAWLGSTPRRGAASTSAASALSARPRRPVVLLAAAAFSGFVSVGLEVLWTRSLATRFMNTVYSFATILTVFLLALGLASVATPWLDRRGWVRRSTLAAVFAAGGILGLASILFLSRIPTSWGEGTGSSVAGFLLRELSYSIALMALPVLVLGLAFPMLVRLAHAEVGAVGRETGEIYLANTAGSVAAPLLLGFAALPAIGLRASLIVVSWGSVLFAALVLLPRSSMARRPALALGGAALVLAASVQLLLPADIRLWRGSPGDVLVDYREGVTSAVAVLDEEGGDRVLKLNNDYVLGGLKGAHLPHRQGLIPLLLHGQPQSALFIGLGTGGSAGAAAVWPDLRVDVLEIVPEVVDMLRWFDSSNESLAERAGGEGRVRILPVDGRHFVLATGRRYDVVVGDLFLPYRAGEGAMYTREHVEAVRRVLAPGGLFCQWLPLYQFRRADLRVAVATFCDVFPHVEAFWLHPDALQPVLGLVGSDEPLAIDRVALETHLSEPALADLLASSDLRSPETMLAGWIADRPALLAWTRGAPVETRDRPRIEFSAPRNTIGSPGDPSAGNLAEFLELTRPATEAGPFARCAREDRERIASYQRALGHLLLSAAAGAGTSSTLEQLELALAEAPTWDLVLGSVKALARGCIDRGDFAAARRAAEILLHTEGQRHSGLYLSALIALRTGDAEAARTLARAALELKPDHRPTRELLQELDQGSATRPAGARPHR
jgi:spermidine synthase